MSDPDLRGLAREAVTFPNALVPAFNTTFPLTETSCAIFASKLLPTTVCEVTRLTVLTVSVVPAGIVAAFRDEAAKQAQHVAMNAMNFFRFILVLEVDGFWGAEEKYFKIQICLLWGRFVRWFGSCNRGGLHRRVNKQEDHSRDGAADKVRYEVDPNIVPGCNTEQRYSKSNGRIKCAT